VTKAFSSEVDPGSREENALNQKRRAPFRFHRNGTGSGAVTAWRAAWLLTRLRLYRQWNIVRSAYRFRKPSSVRTATAPAWRSPLGWLITIAVALAMIGNCVNLSHRSMVNFQKTLGTAEVHKAAPRSWLGVRLASVTSENAKELGVDATSGALIASIIDRGPAQAAGLKPGDVIVTFDGKTIKDYPDLQRVLGVTPAGKTVKLGLLRGGVEQRATMKLAVHPEDAKPSFQSIAPTPGSMLAPGVLRGAVFDATLLLVAAVLLTLAGREITKPEWDLEWLATLPLPLPTLLACRLVERSVTNPAGLVLFAPFLAVVAGYCGYRWSAPLIGMGLATVLLLVVAAVQTLVDTGLRLSWSPPRLRNLHALISLVSAFPLAFALATALHDNTFVFGWIAELPDWIGFLPPGLAVRAIAASDGLSAAIWVALMVAEVLAFAAIAFGVLQLQLRNGVVMAGTRESVARLPRAAPSTKARFDMATSLLSPVQRRELILLGRDRTFLTQTLLLPAVTVGVQVFILASSNIFAGAVEHPQNLAAIAFVLATYTLMFSAFQTLNAEGQALWILYSVPCSLESILRQKAKLWGAAAAIYPILVFAITAGLAGHITLLFASLAAIVLLGVPIFAVIATALGVFACNPLAQDVQRKIRPTFLYLYMLLVSLYVYAIYASKISQQAATIVLAALLAIALWQKARDRFDYLLDPTEAPPARVSVSDGLIAALMFFVVQALVVVVLQLDDTGLSIGTTVWIAFCVAGAATYTVTRLVYRWAKTDGVPRVFGPNLPRALLLGLAGGVVASLVGLAYIEILASMHMLPPLREAARAADQDTAIWLPALAVAAAPVFEEFIFRGLIFGGLRRSLGLGAATLASAAIFAIVHPPLSIVPVFFMAVCAALVYERTKMLAAPMVVHALYNATVLGFQWNVMQ
jgi:ABC-2 type transport system permease protein